LWSTSRPRRPQRLTDACVGEVLLLILPGLALAEIRELSWPEPKDRRSCGERDRRRDMSLVPDLPGVTPQRDTSVAERRRSAIV